MTCLKFKFENTKIMFPMSGEGQRIVWGKKGLSSARGNQSKDGGKARRGIGMG